MNSKAKQGTDFEANQQQEKSVWYGFGTTAFIVPVLDAKLHANRGKRVLLSVRTGRTTTVLQ
jgi:hypothetical protein